jgi:hypothetical protein
MDPVAAAGADAPSAARIHPTRWAIPTITISAMAAARNNPSGSSFLVIQANRLGIGEEEDADDVILAFDGSFDITNPFVVHAASSTIGNSPLERC